jgi:hypothetical protein
LPLVLLVLLNVDTSGKFATNINDTGGKLPPVSMTLAVSLPTVSTKPVANNRNNIDCVHLKVNLREKNLSIYPDKII